MSRIGHNKASEVVVTFGPVWFSRRETINQDIFDDVFGSREAWHRDSADEGWRYWLQTYKAALKRAGFEFPLNFEVMPTSGHPLYLVYGTGHSRGVEVFKDAMWSVDRHDGMRFNDPRTNAARIADLERYQGDLLALLDGEPEDAPDKELRALILDRLEDGPATLAEIRDWVLLETAYWRKSDATPAVEFLIGQQLVERVSGQGRITGATLLRLVGGPAAGGTRARTSSATARRWAFPGDSPLAGQHCAGLLEEVGHAGGAALVTDIDRPLGQHRPRAVAGLTADDHPVDVI
jgi:hypothetical protein